MDHYQEILSDIIHEIPESSPNILLSYNDEMELDKKFKAILRTIERAKRLRNRLMHLISLFHLGKFLEVEIESTLQRSQFARQLSLHNRTVAIRMYYIFEKFGTQQILQTTKMTVTNVRNLTHEQYQNLIIFNGVENLGGE
jgi:hypothetical protein